MDTTYHTRHTFGPHLTQPCPHLNEWQEHVGPHRLIKLVILPARHEALRLVDGGVGPLVVHTLCVDVCVCGGDGGGDGGGVGVGMSERPMSATMTLLPVGRTTPSHDPLLPRPHVHHHLADR